MYILILNLFVCLYLHHCVNASIRKNRFVDTMMKMAFSNIPNTYLKNILNTYHFTWLCEWLNVTGFYVATKKETLGMRVTLCLFFNLYSLGMSNVGICVKFRKTPRSPFCYLPL